MNVLKADEIRRAARSRRACGWLPALAVLPVMVILPGCGTPTDAPQASNQASSRAVRVWGEVAPDLTLRVFTRWLSAAAGCRQAENLFRRLDGTTAPSSVWVEAGVQRNGEAYEARVALDHFAAGECGWHPFVVAFQLTNADGISTGHFEPAAGGGRALVPGPQELVWIDSAQGRVAPRGGGRPAGSKFVRPLELTCAENSVRGARGLSCVPDSPRELALIAEDAPEVRVDFRSGAPGW